jgi:hypothetical protein
MVMEIQIVAFRVMTLYNFVYVSNVWMNLLSLSLKWKCKYHARGWQQVSSKQ